jgi:hypothetical protein
MKADGMSETCNAHGRVEKYAKKLIVKTEGRDYLEDLDIDVRIILK